MVPSDALIVLDTNILVAWLRGNALGNYIRKKYELDIRVSPAVAIVTVGEIYALAKKLAWGHKKEAELAQLLSRLVVIDINHEDVIQRYAEIDYYFHSLKPARSVGKNDIWIAAVASVAKAYLLTTDKDCLPLDPKFLSVEWVDETAVLAATKNPQTDLFSTPEISFD